MECQRPIHRNQTGTWKRAGLDVQTACLPRLLLRFLYTYIHVDAGGHSWQSLTEAGPRLPESITLPAFEGLCKAEACICLNLDVTGVPCPCPSVCGCISVCPVCAFVSLRLLTWWPAFPCPCIEICMDVLARYAFEYM